MTERGVKIGWMKAGKAGRAAVAVVATLLLVACSSGGDAPEAPPTPPTDPTNPTTPTTPAGTPEIPVVVCMSAASFEDGAEEQYAARRAWTPPTGYHLYSKLYEKETYVNLPDMGQSTIDLFMTHDKEAGDAQLSEDVNPLFNPLHARLSYSSSTKKWKLVLPNGVKEEDLTKDTKGQGNYYAYGFVPRDAADGASIAKLPESSKWADGAILTIQGLKSVAVDPCVIIGANDGPDENNDGRSKGVGGSASLRAGDFKFYLDTGTTGSGADEKINPNYLYFLFDHLYSAFSISMRVNPTYHALRHIHLKAIYLQTETTSGAKPSKMNVTIRLEKNNDGSNPIVGDIVYSPVESDTPTKRLIYSNSAGYPLTDEYSMFLGHFMPYNVSRLILTSVYDVYDTNTTPEHPNGNLIREDCEATNALSMSQLFTGQTVSHRGWKYKVKLTINPTYLYMMSDPDLDNPTVVVN